MRVRIFGVVEVQREIRDHAARDKFSLHEIPQELDLLVLRKLDRQPHLDLTRYLRVLASLGGLDFIPQPLSVIHPSGAPSGARISECSTPTFLL